MLENGLITYKMELVNSPSPTEMFTTVTSKTENSKATEDTPTKVELYTKENGKMINGTDPVSTSTTKDKLKNKVSSKKTPVKEKKLLLIKLKLYPKNSTLITKKF